MREDEPGDVSLDPEKIRLLVNDPDVGSVLTAKLFKRSVTKRDQSRVALERSRHRMQQLKALRDTVQEAVTTFEKLAVAQQASGRSADDVHTSVRHVAALKSELAAVQAKIDAETTSAAALRAHVEQAGAAASEPTPKSTAEGSSVVQLIGTAHVPLAEVLGALPSDKDVLEELLTLATLDHHKVGSVLVKLKFLESAASDAKEIRPLATVDTAVLGFDTIEKANSDTETSLYPLKSALVVSWRTSDACRENDVCALIRMKDDGLSMPLFRFQWQEKDGELDWRPPPVEGLETRYHSAVITDASRRHGQLHFPSADNLSLVPGYYVVVVVRSDGGQRHVLPVG
ncbi:hypothetical protein P43SY_010252 [Pythium insidiosum]|uniref:Uncharacterized protein n=1 Tax=Pythium insidiosum TaxID=114742 RepID=A0AAD5LRL3_PYTIN|nr:hypothetical protein P43SY_010252 [Pythium insidiosum]